MSVGERVIEGPEMIEVTNAKVAVAKEKLKEARTRQKSYADKHRRSLEFQPDVPTENTSFGSTDMADEENQETPKKDKFVTKRKRGHLEDLCQIMGENTAACFLLNLRRTAKYAVMLVNDYDDDSNILHLAGRLAPIQKFNVASGAALQMQQELQWFEIAWIRRIGNWSNAFSCEVLALIRRISFVGYGVLITSDYESECETHEPLPPLLKPIGTAPAGISDSLISLANLTPNMADVTLNLSIPKKTKPTSVKVSPAYAIKKKTENKSPATTKSCSNKKADSFTKQLLLTSMEEESGPKVVLEIHLKVTHKDIAQSTIIESLSPRKMENLNEVKVKELRSDYRTEFRNHKLEEFYDEKGEAINTSCYTQNRSIIVKRHRKTAYDVFRGRTPDIIYFYVFGCPVHIHNHRDHLGKFDEKVDGGFFLCYSPMAKTFKKQDYSIPCNIEYFPYIPAYNITSTNSPIPQVSISPKEPPKFTDANDDPALNKLDHPKLSDDLEPAKLYDNVTNEPISDVQPTIIFSPLAKGYNKQEGIDYKETFALVARLEAIKIFFAYAAYMGFMVCQMDVTSAFLNGRISEEVYVQQPPGFESSEFPNHVCKLDKALYRLKQAPRAWYETLSKFLIQHKFIRDYTGCTLDRKSTLRGCQILGGKLCWSAKKQSSVAIPSVKADPSKGDCEGWSRNSKTFYEKHPNLSSTELTNSSLEVNADDTANKSSYGTFVHHAIQPKVPTDLKPKNKRIPPSSKPKSSIQEQMAWQTDYCIMKEGLPILKGRKSIPGMNSSEREIKRGYYSAFTQRLIASNIAESSASSSIPKPNDPLYGEFMKFLKNKKGNNPSYASALNEEENEDSHEYHQSPYKEKIIFLEYQDVKIS
nr:retrovirus-related Pol polyprotein from transposon TNT 1-94 [Tanacetum cinerariifolium]